MTVNAHSHHEGTPGIARIQVPEISEVVTVPISCLASGVSPRSNGESEAHIAQLAEVESALPPLLVDRSTMRVIDGMHRLRAARLKGRDTIEVIFFDGTAADAFLRAVEANVKHGLPLSYADRKVAAARIITSHPQLSDRALAESAGLSARVVAAIRRSTESVPQLNARVGKDGKTRPVSHVEGRQRAAEKMAENPKASLREIAQSAGISPATARDVRKRLERGDDPLPGRLREVAGNGNGAALQVGRMGIHPVMGLTQSPPATVLEKLTRDPSLRGQERGRRLLELLHHNAVNSQDWSAMVSAVPPHCADLMVQAARHSAQLWLKFAQDLERRSGKTWS
jgi:ParB-like chromosome segregation protein Spo0J